MKSSGYIRKVDPMGRIVIPANCRELLGIKTDDSLELFIDGETMMLRKYRPACIFCDSMDELMSFKGRSVCKSCAEKLASCGESVLI